ncbi:MAG: alpha/beta fold hydrolase [Acidimicrobiia bacterium]|nr:alpha/beta fold hydrolase [Acidimicrobiia bacterium]
MSNPPSATSKQVAVSRLVSLNTRDWPGTGRVPFLLIHGLASNARMWDGVAESLAATGHDTVAVDLRGHGESTQVDDGFDWETLSDDLAAVAAAHSWESFVAVGQSWGGNVALELAAHQPRLVTAVGLVDGGFLRLRDDFPTWREAEAALAPPRFNGVKIEAMEAWMRSQDDGFPESSISGRLANFAVTEEGGVRNRLSRENHIAILRHLWEHDPDTVGAGVTVPIDVVAVSGGPPRKADRVAAFAEAAGATVHWREGHHDIHAQQPELVAGLLSDLARRVTP